MRSSEHNVEKLFRSDPMRPKANRSLIAIAHIPKLILSILLLYFAVSFLASEIGLTHVGFIPNECELSSIKPGMSKKIIKNILGSPFRVIKNAYYYGYNTQGEEWIYTWISRGKIVIGPLLHSESGYTAKRVARLTFINGKLTGVSTTTVWSSLKKSAKERRTQT